MDDATQRVLRKACSRFKTGIRKPFKLDGETVSFEAAGYYLDADIPDDEEGSVWCEAYLVVPRGSVNALDGSRGVLKIVLTSVTPEAVWVAYLQSQVDAVHAL